MHRKGAQGGRLVSRGTSRSRSLPSLTFHSDAYSSWASVVVALMWKADFDDARVCHEVSEAWRRVHEERNGGGAWGGQAQCSRCAKRHPRASPSPTSLPPTRPPSPRLRKENNNKGGWLSIEGCSAHHTISSVNNRSTTREDENKKGIEEDIRIATFQKPPPPPPHTPNPRHPVTDSARTTCVLLDRSLAFCCCGLSPLCALASF